MKLPHKVKQSSARMCVFFFQIGIFVFKTYLEKGRIAYYGVI